MRRVRGLTLPEFVATYRHDDGVEPPDGMQARLPHSPDDVIGLAAAAFGVTPVEARAAIQRAQRDAGNA